MTRELLSFKDFSGGLMLDQSAFEVSPDKTPAAFNFRAKNNSLYGILTEGNDRLSLSATTGISYTHSVNGTTALGDIYGVKYVEGLTAATDNYLVVVAQNGVVAIPVGGPEVINFLKSLGTVATGYALIEGSITNTNPTFLVSNGFLYIGGASTLFRWKIGSTAAADKITAAAGANTGPPANAKLLASYGGRAWARDSSKPLRLYYSGPEDNTNGFVNSTAIWPPNILDLPTINYVGGERAHTGISTPDGLAVFTNRSLRLIYDSDNGFNSVVDPENGAYEGSVVQVGDTIYGMNQKGVFTTSGRMPVQYITEGRMESWFSANNITEAEGLTAAVYDGSYWVSFIAATGYPGTSVAGATQRMTIEVNLTTGSVMWHTKPMDVRWLAPVPRTTQSPAKLLGVRASLKGSGAGWSNGILVNLLHSSNGDSSESQYSSITLPMMLEEREFRVRRVTVFGKDPAYVGYGGLDPLRQIATDDSIGVLVNGFVQDAGFGAWYRLSSSNAVVVDSANPNGASGTYAGTLVGTGAGADVNGALVSGGDNDNDLALGTAGAYVSSPYYLGGTSTWSAAGFFRRRVDTGGNETIFSTLNTDATAFDTTVLADSNRIAYWKLNDASASGTAVDAVGARNGAYGASAAAGAANILAGTGSGANPSLAISAAAAAVTIAFAAALNPTNPFILEAWVKQSSTAGTQVIYDCLDTANFRGFQLSVVAGVPRVQFGNGASITTIVGTAITSNRSHHIAFLRDSGPGSLLYVDGALAASSGAAFSANTTLGSKIGATIAGASAFNGSISKVLLTSNALGMNPLDIAARYAIGRFGALTGLALIINEADQLEMFVGNGMSSSASVTAQTISTSSSAWRYFAIIGSGTGNGIQLWYADTPTNSAFLPTQLLGVTYVSGGGLTATFGGRASVVGTPLWSLQGDIDEFVMVAKALSPLEIYRYAMLTNSLSDLNWLTRCIQLQLVDQLDPSYVLTFALTWKRGTWTVARATDRGYARVSGFRARSLAIRVLGYAGLRIDRIDIEVDRLSRRHP